MSTEIAINRPAQALTGTAPVAMHRGRCRDRLALARLRVKRRWLLRRRHKAILASNWPPPPTRQHSERREPRARRQGRQTPKA